MIEQSTGEGDLIKKEVKVQTDCLEPDERCKVCGEELYLCSCSTLPDEKLEDTLCEGCPSHVECMKREERNVRVLQAQFYHCHSVLGRRDFHPDKNWIYYM